MGWHPFNVGGRVNQIERSNGQINANDRIGNFSKINIDVEFFYPGKICLTITKRFLFISCERETG